MTGNRTMWRHSRPLILVSTMALAFAFILPLTGVALANHGGRTLEVTPEEAENPADDTTDHELLATLSAAATDVINIDFEIVAGPTDADGNTPLTPDLTCNVAVTDVDCTVVTGPSDTAGDDEVMAWIDHDGLNSTVEADTTEGPDASDTVAELPGGTNEPGGDAEPDLTDVVVKTWTPFLAAACLDAEPPTAFNARGDEHLITVEVTDSAAAFMDADDTFDCAGSALADVNVEVTVTPPGDDDPNVFISSVNGTSTGGPTGGGPNTVAATTDATGMIEVGIELVNPADPLADDTNLIAFDAGADTGSDSEIVEKVWGIGGEPSEIEALPRADTNEIGDSHTVTATVLDAFEDPVEDANVDFHVSAGPHVDNNLDADADTFLGYFGECTTGADGTCSASYEGSEVGTDTIVIFVDANLNDTHDEGEPSSTLLIQKTWVAAGEGPATVRLDMDGCNGDTSVPIDEATWNATADNDIADVHQICADVFDADGGRLAAPVTFSLTGVGHFTNAAGTEDLGTEVTVQEPGGDAFNSVYVTSTESGETTIEASSHGLSDTGTKTWTAAPGTARNIDALPDTASNEPGTIHTVTATVTDRFGNPVPDVQVTFTETGPGAFRTGGSLVVAFTDDAGVATAETTTLATELGEQTIVAEITEDPSECAETGDPAGNCTDTVTKTWEEKPDGVEFCPGFDGDPRNQVVGTSAGETLVGTGGRDIICGKGGDDEINGKGGKDLLLGGRGNDDIFGKKGNDRLKGGKGRDFLNGGKGTDVCKGGPGRDTTVKCEN